MTDQNEIERSRKIEKKNAIDLSTLSVETISKASRDAIRYLIWRDKQESNIFSEEQRAVIAKKARDWDLPCSIVADKPPGLDDMFQKLSKQQRRSEETFERTVKRVGKTWDKDFGHCFPDLMAGKMSEEEAEEENKGECARQIIMLEGKPELIRFADEDDMKMIASMLRLKIVMHPDTLKAWHSRAAELEMPLNFERIALEKTQGGIVQEDCREGYIMKSEAREKHDTLLATLYSRQLMERNSSSMKSEHGNLTAQGEVTTPAAVGGIDRVRGLAEGLMEVMDNTETEKRNQKQS